MKLSQYIKQLQELEQINENAEIEFYINNDNQWEWDSFEKANRKDVVIKEHKKANRCVVDTNYISSNIINTSRFSIDLYISE